MKGLWICLLLMLCQCGYNWGHQTRELPGGHKTVYVEVFGNQSEEVGLEATFAQALNRELERSGFALVSSRNQAEVILKGNILSATNGGGGAEATFIGKNYANDPSQRTFQTYKASFFTNYNMSILVNLKAIRSRDEQLIWQTNVSGSRAYQGALLREQGLRSSNVLYNEARKKETVKLIALEMMSDAFDRLTENF